MEKVNNEPNLRKLPLSAFIFTNFGEIKRILLRKIQEAGSLPTGRRVARPPHQQIQKPNRSWDFCICWDDRARKCCPKADFSFGKIQ